MRSNLSHERDERHDIKCPGCGAEQDNAVAHCPSCGINVQKALDAISIAAIKAKRKVRKRSPKKPERTPPDDNTL